MPIKKHINLNVGSFLNPADKKIVVNLASEYILTLITQELKTRYSPETQKQLLEESSQLLPDFVLQELLKRQEQVVNVNPDTLQRFRLLCNTVFLLALSYQSFQIWGCTS